MHGKRNGSEKFHLFSAPGKKNTPRRHVAAVFCLLVLAVCTARPAQAATVLTGTGFVVSRQGHVLTNYHVIEGTRGLRGQIDGREFTLTVLRTDPDRDLALLQIQGQAPPPLAFRQGKPIRPGDAVVAVGYPLQGILAHEANVTTGDMSASAGPGGNRNLIQITAPIQPGNSGGPVLDSYGLVVGVAVAQLGVKDTFAATGDIPQNVNFAVKGSVAQDFLEKNGVLLTLRDPVEEKRPADIGETARRSSVFIIGDLTGSAAGPPRPRDNAPSPPDHPPAGQQQSDLPPVIDNPAGRGKLNYALEYLRDNQPQVWQDRDSGQDVTVKATATHEYNNRPPCRDFSVEWGDWFYEGRACRQGRENWRIE
ncbi:MAG: trypsin-like peptidase domain-containing protein [Desulfovibrionaceae bacterium]|nr:trypsin-like peptidase domain-containing protein [Desulfovibrionaceae bacterium]MBF0513992.1 trypsin-like peptidase domain-containing protein [Desulfovibrionaceae bacterium]